MAYKLLIVEDEKEKATGIAYLTGKYIRSADRFCWHMTEEKDMRKPSQSSRILLLRISECLKWTDWK